MLCKDCNLQSAKLNKNIVRSIFFIKILKSCINTNLKKNLFPIKYLVLISVYLIFF